MRERDDKETSLVIDHQAAVFHITSNRIRLARHLRKLASEYKLTLEESFGQITLTNVPVKYLSKLQIATHSQEYPKTELQPL